MKQKDLSKKREEEIKVTKFFIDYLNKEFNFDYKVKWYERDEEIDTCALSTSGEYKQLNFQIRRIDDEVIKEFINLQREAERTGKEFAMGLVRDFNIEKWIEDAIKDKEKHYGYGNPVKKNLILLLWINFGPLFNPDYAQKIFAYLKDSEFKGVYFVHLPTSPNTSSYPHNGQIIAIKDAF